MAREKIDIVLPGRIGDSILNLPMIVCLKQLSEKYSSNLKIKIIAKPYLIQLLAPLELFDVRPMDWKEKVKSWICPSDRVFFVETTNKNFAYHSKKSYGIENNFKKFLKFSVQPKYLLYSTNQLFLTYGNLKTFLPENLLEFLVDKYKLSYSSISLFGICLELGYITEQITETFNFSEELINLDNFNDPSLKLPKSPYLIFCIEAGYNKKHMDERCWDIEKYFEVADRCNRDYGYKAAFVGVNREIALPEKDYIEDYRGRLSLFQLACLIKSSHGYIGNDTGPLHIANLMKRPSVAAYFSENPKIAFGPIFAELNTQVLQPQTVDEFYCRVQNSKKLY